LRRTDVFFYGLFMDADLLHAKGMEAKDAEMASVDGFTLRIGHRAALVPTPGGRVHGLVFSLTLAELDRLYSDPSVQAYKPQAVLAQMASGGLIAALCYNLPKPPLPGERNPEYAAKLRALAQRIGLPAEYVASLQQSSSQQPHHLGADLPEEANAAGRKPMRATAGGSGSSDMTRLKSLDGIRMHVVSTDSKGEVGSGTRFSFFQEGSLVSAQYSGGNIRLGQLIGTISGGQLSFRFVQVDPAGRIDGGSSICELEVLADGRLRMREHFHWDSREGSGTNVFEEIAGS
jgi:hypothetical protein